MKRIVTQISIIALILSIVSVSCSQEQKSNITLIAILNVRENLIKKVTTEEILLFSKELNGNYEVVSHWDEKEKTMISQRETLLRTFRKFRVYRQGTAIKEITLTKIGKANFDCEELTVGTGKSIKLVNDINKYKSANFETSGGFNQYGSFKYNNSRYIAINSDSRSIKTQLNSISIRSKISDEKLIHNFAVKELLQKNSEIKESDIKITTLLGYNLNNDKRTDYVVVAKGENDNTKESGIFVLNIEEDRIISLLNEGMGNEPSSWGNGYELLDVLDLDGDTIPELIFETKGYESTGYEIYKIDNNKFIKVFSDVIYGC